MQWLALERASQSACVHITALLLVNSLTLHKFLHLENMGNDMPRGGETLS